MRNIIILLIGVSIGQSFSCFAQPHGVAAEPVPAHYNSIRRDLIKKKGVVTPQDIINLSASDKRSVINYYDGLGRPLADIGVMAGGNQKDIVSLHGYDVLGRIDTTFLPYVASTMDGSFSRRGAMIPLQKNFYNNSGDKVADDSYPYALSIYDTSPAAYVKEQGAPGAAWQTGTTHTVTRTTYFNAASSIRIWKDLSSPGYYAVNTVAIEEVTDENGNKVKTFTSQDGLLIQKWVQVDASNWLKTLYIYDDHNRLLRMIQPKGVDAIGSSTSISTDIAKDFGFYYGYDNEGRVVTKKVPGADSVFYGYDPLGRLSLMQDGNLRLANQWLYTKYDRNGRAIIQGIYTNATYTTRVGVQTNVLNTLSYSTGETFYEKMVNGGTHGYTNQSFPTSSATVMSVVYYDTYDLDVSGTDDYSYVAQGLVANTPQGDISEPAPFKTIGRVTATKVSVMGTSNWIYKYQFYDCYGRVIQVRSNNHLTAASGVIDNLTTALYDFEGKVWITKTYHNAGGSNTLTTTVRNEYDQAGRILRVYHGLNGGLETVTSDYKYNELGQLVEKNLHCTTCSDPGTLPSNTVTAANITRSSYSSSEQNLYATQSIVLSPGFDTGTGVFDAKIIGTAPGSGTFLQSVDYRYNIRGWLTSINNSQLTTASNNDDTNDYFGMELGYEADIGISNTALYNGNISGVKWKNFGESNPSTAQRSYVFAYDKSDRLTQASFKANGSSNSWDKETNTLDEGMTYDANGNMLTLTRKQNNRGLSGTSVTSSAQTLDGLTFTYATGYGNRMSKVEDSGTTGGFNNTVTFDAEYKYDTIGNLVKDRNKGIGGIQYNELGKVKQINFDDGRYITYAYDASGNKLTVKNYNSSATLTTTTDYVDGFVYVNAALSFFGSPEGRVVKNGGAFEYQYAIKDHQGNTRVIFTSVTPAAVTKTATFETGAGDDSGEFTNVSNVVSFTAANHTASGIKVVRMNQSYPTGPAKSLKVYPGDKVDMEVYTYYESSSGYGNTNNTVASMVTAIAGAFGGVNGAAGESGTIYSGVNTAVGAYGLGSNPGDTRPSAFLNYILFDQNYKVLDMGWTAVPSSANFAKQLISIPQLTIKEAGYVFTYLSYESQSNNYVYFDDFRVTHTKSNLIQASEYYPFGMQTAVSWMRDDAAGNSFLYNSGAELNALSGWYDTSFRGYDPVLGRFMQVDPLGANTAGLSPYHYANNSPVLFNDPSGLTSVADVEDVIRDLFSHSYGGHWANDGTNSGAGSTDYFGSEDEAFKYGVAYNEDYGYWENTSAGSREQAESNYSRKSLTPGSLNLIRNSPVSYDYGDGKQNIGMFIALEYYPSADQLDMFSSFNLIATKQEGEGAKEEFITSDIGNEGPYYYDPGNWDRNSLIMMKGGDRKIVSFTTYRGGSAIPVTSESTASFYLKIQFFGFSNGTAVSLGTADFSFRYSKGTVVYNDPILKVY